MIDGVPLWFIVAVTGQTVVYTVVKSVTKTSPGVALGLVDTFPEATGKDEPAEAVLTAPVAYCEMLAGTVEALPRTSVVLVIVKLKVDVTVEMVEYVLVIVTLPEV